MELKGIVNLPLEIIFEIFAVLPLEHLFHLSRVNKAFHELLHDPAAASFWKAAWSRAERLPALPPHLSIPSYASLLFSTDCRACGISGNFAVLTGLFTRYCDECMEIRLVMKDSYDFKVPGGRSCVNSNHLNDRYWKQWMLLPEAEYVQRRWEALNSEKEKQDYLAERTEFVLQCLKLAWPLQHWFDTAEQRRVAALHALKVERLNGVKQRLRAEGWEVADLNGCGLELIRDVYKPEWFIGERGLEAVNAAHDGPYNSPLTEWQAIHTDAVKILEAHRIKRLQDEEDRRIQSNLTRLRSIIERYQRSFFAPGAGLGYFPTVFEVATMPAIQPFVEQNPLFDVGDPAAEQEVAALLPGLNQELTAGATHTLAAMVREALGTNTASLSDTDILELATSYFQCLTCGQGHLLRWRQLFRHSCSKRTGHYSTWGRNDYKAAVARHAFRFSNGRSVRVNFVRGVASRRAIVASCGFDPDRATFTDMDTCGVRLRCLRCRSYPEKQVVLDWEGAILHDASRHGGCPKKAASHWERIADENAARVCELQDALRCEPAETDRGTCSWCGCHTYRNPKSWHNDDDLMTISVVEDHLRDRHKKVDAEEGVDYVVDWAPRQAITIFKPSLKENKTATSKVKAGLGFFADF
ncbi:uncharacterized protein BXZ73DRAFT_97848 [Epithele typhae]|uniref:uncharacterized protein n=1 Tax=Epithele typhae TaxID=378194 RepID=UPI002007A0B1|nr:uncharacterized protein BXZ73DRAFT_97848 [Epithele typhae]KAH9942437.1 hypothetical protein BXZ73DRAFT_97848 [Epithele typhae]